MNKKILSISLFILLFLGINYVFALSTNLEVSYPKIPKIETPTSTDSSIILYLVYVYELSIITAAFLVFVIFLIGGWKYIFSVGDPVKKMEGRKQISAALLGFIIILGSYMILNTINPWLLNFPKILLKDISNDEPEHLVEQFFDDIAYDELPLGNLITCEYGASSFLYDATLTDPIIDIEPDPEITDVKDYINAFPDSTKKSYNSDFQGALHGRRLKRIWEVASTTETFASSTISLIFQDFSTTTQYIGKRVNRLIELAQQCSCDKCKKDCANKNGDCKCPCNNNGNPCGDGAKEMQEIREELPKIYEGDNSLLHCKILELEYVSKLFNAFTNQGKVVYNEYFPDNSFVDSDEEKELRKLIEDCQSPEQGDNLNIPSRYSEIIKAIPGLMTTENKGNWSPTSSLPERDVGSNFSELKVIYDAILEIKEKVTPETADPGNQVLTFLQLEAGKADTQTFDPDQAPSDYVQVNKIDVNPYTLTFSSPIAVKKVKILKYSGDPASFYISAQESQQELIISFKKILNKIASIFKADPVEAQEITEGLDEIDKNICSPLVEIPIGTATDKALSLTKDILNELEKIKNASQALTDQTEIIKENEQPFKDAINAIIELTLECKTECSSACNCSCSGISMTDCNCDEDGNCEQCCTSCTCTCSSADGKPICPPIDPGEFNKTYGVMEEAIKKIEEGLNAIKKTFIKLNSEPNKDIEDYLGKDVCCIDGSTGSNCRNTDGSFVSTATAGNNSTGKSIEVRKYTLKEKLIEVQILLNRSREIGPPTEDKDSKSDYQILYEDLKKIKLPVDKSGTSGSEELVSKMMYVLNEGPGGVAGGKNSYLDLSNCGTRAQDIEVAEGQQEFDTKETFKIFYNSSDVRGDAYLDESNRILDQSVKELCAKDPLLDCYYFSKDFYYQSHYRQQIPHNCYYYIEDIEDKEYPPDTRIPEGGNLASNFYCCASPRQPEKELEY